ncbi:MAG: vWA domain-containing protein, partial [Ardenticatenaceae bacterium]
MSFRLASPWFLSLLLLLPIFATLPLWMKRHKQPATLRYAAIKSTQAVAGSWRVTLRPVVALLRWLGLALLIVGLARPQTSEAQQVIKGEGVDIALALDISGSMASLDFEPKNRLEAAKQVIEDFVKERPYDRIGLTVFANEAFSQSPLTIDHAVLSRLLKEVELAPDLNIDDGTAIGLGLANGANMLSQSTSKSKVVIILTDGVNNAGRIDPLTATEAAKALGIKVYTIGMGRPGLVPVPQRDPLLGTQLVYQESQIDEATLQEIADKTGGLYFRAENTEGLREIYEQINQLEKSEVEIRVFRQYQELAAWLLVPALLLLLLEQALSKTIFR